MAKPRTLATLIATVMLALGLFALPGCVAYTDGYYGGGYHGGGGYAYAPAYVAPARPYHGGWGGRGYGRGWR